MLDINNKKDSAAIQEVLKQGTKSEFWKLVVQAIEESKKHLRDLRDSDDLKDLPADQYKTESEIIKYKIKYLNKLLETPGNLSSWLENPDNKKPDFDPYD